MAKALKEEIAELESRMRRLEEEKEESVKRLQGEVAMKQNEVN